MTNMGVEVALRALGVELVRARVGDRYVLEELLARGWLLGGESSGHLLTLDRHTTGDGIVSALQILQAVGRDGRSLSQQLAPVQLYGQTLINVRRAADAPPWTDNARLQATQQTVRRELGEQGRVLIRASGTEPLVRVMVEARDAALAADCAERLASTLRE